MTPGALGRRRRSALRPGRRLPVTARWKRGPPGDWRVNVGRGGAVVPRGGIRVTLATPAQAGPTVGAGQRPYRYSGADTGGYRREWAVPASGYPET